MINVDWTFYWIVKLFNKPQFFNEKYQIYNTWILFGILFYIQTKRMLIVFIFNFKKNHQKSIFENFIFCWNDKFVSFSINNNTNKVDREIINQHFNSND